MDKTVVICDTNGNEYTQDDLDVINKKNQADYIVNSLLYARQQGVLVEVLNDFLYDVIRQAEGYGRNVNISEAMNHACREWDI